MTISEEKAVRLVELAANMTKMLDEFKRICQNAMTTTEYNRFKYNTLAHLEPGLLQEHDWICSGVVSLAEVGEDAVNELNELEMEEES